MRSSGGIRGGGKGIHVGGRGRVDEVSQRGGGRGGSRMWIGMTG